MEEIDYSEIRPLPTTFFERARIWRPQPQVTLKLQVDADILEWFRNASDNWEARMQAALRLYGESLGATKAATESCCHPWHPGPGMDCRDDEICGWLGERPCAVAEVVA